MSEMRVRVDDDISPLLGDSAEESERQALEMIVLGHYRRRTISAGRTAADLGMEELAFIRWAGALGIPYFDLPADELGGELRILGNR